MALTAQQLNQMTLAEILAALKLPSSLTRGDADHEETTAVMDRVAAENWRNNNVAMEAA